MNGGSPTWFGVQVPFSLETLLAIEFVAMAGAESLRGAQEDPEKRKYPGGPFDPAGLAKVPLLHLILPPFTCVEIV